jgi:delta24-sterol reductase
MEAHNATVSSIASRVKHFHELQQPFRIYHGSTNSTRQSHRRADNTVDTSGLKNILSIDSARQTAIVEPNVPMDALVAAALRHGLVPPVVMELPGITVGGGFSGTSGESSSFRYGAFDMTVNEIEIVLPDGTVVGASSKGERADVFWGAASAFGTLGVVTLLEVQLKEAKKYVQLTYTLCASAADSVVRIREECGKEGNDYVDGIVLSKGSTLVCAGRLVDEIPAGSKIRQFTRRKDPWFYLRGMEVEKQLKKKATNHNTKKSTEDSEDAVVTDVVTDYIPLEDYLFRYDRGGFWVARYAYKYFLTPFNRVTRYILDPLMHTREMYRALHQSGLTNYYMIQDVGVPYGRVPEFQSWLDESFGIYPLWLCPLRLQRDDPSSAHGLHAQFAQPDTPELMNFGVWGPLDTTSSGGGWSSNRRDAIRQNRLLEQKVSELGGKKWLYAQAFYTEDEFWAHYDRASYDALREKYGAGYLPSVYDKVRVDADAEEAARNATWKTRAKGRFWDVWPTRGLYGVYKTLGGGDYLLQNKRKDGNKAVAEEEEKKQR